MYIMDCLVSTSSWFPNISRYLGFHVPRITLDLKIQPQPNDLQMYAVL
jgi:hypothetical protein